MTGWRWLGALVLIAAPTLAQPVPVQVERTATGWQLLRGGEPYRVLGLGGESQLEVAARLGANSIRTWGVEGLGAKLDVAHALGMTVTAGIWLGHVAHGFDWHDEAALERQRAAVRAAIEQYRDHPALLAWGLGNEMEMGQAEEPVVWQEIQRLAQLAHVLDPHHPTMTVIAELGGAKLAALQAHCPSIDIVGINSYAGAPSVPRRYAEQGGDRPYLLTEFGPPGVWEGGPRTPWDAPEELTSAEKVAWYERSYRANVLDNADTCLGSYAFLWGTKQEASATWFGLLLPDGARLAATDALSEFWTGRPVDDPVPTIEPLVAEGPREGEPGHEVRVRLVASDPAGGPLQVDWLLSGDPATGNAGGATEATPPTYPRSILAADETGATVRLPAAGRYRLFAFVRNGRGGAATANLALHGVPRAVATDPTKALPVLAEGAAPQLWAPTGYMGTTEAIAMDPAWTDRPHEGATCLRVAYESGEGWGGVVWQHPANDWGQQAGGWDLSGASALRFWARGERGGEVVTFSFGTLRDTPVRDTAHGELQVTLTPEWTQYTIDVAGADLSRIKSGFAWVVAGQGRPVVFFVDGVEWVGLDQAGAPPPLPELTPARAAQLPLVVYDEPGGAAAWVPSGYMGDHTSLVLDPASTDAPHGGTHCLRVDYRAAGGWAGVVWQDPANDWRGEQAGGWDLRGSHRLSFWARGAAGGERLTVRFGLTQTGDYRDSAQGELAVTLTDAWQQFSLDVADLDLSRVKTGFCLVIADALGPLTVYLDDVVWE